MPSAPPFRAWLAERLLGTEYARMVISDDRIDAVAKKLGVDPELLLEVRIKARLLRTAAGVQEPPGPRKPGSRHCQIRISMPEVVYVAWQEECEFRGVDGAALLRSVMHAYLLGSREPGPMLSYWLYRGRKERLPKVPNHQRWQQKTLITHGAWRALKRRSQRFGASSTAVLRALVLEVIEGAHRSVMLIDARTMYDDEDRYYLGE